MSKRPIVHIEIPAANRESLGQFYSEMFGWNISHMSEPVPYSMFEGGNIGGGFPDVGEMYQPGDVIVYIGSDDIEADLAKIEELGGKAVTPKMEVPGMGWLAMFTDPTGNRLALWKPAPGQE
jgi:uncharacterized protein